MPTSQTAEQIIAAASVAPVNNLVILVAIIAMATVVFGILVSWKVFPPLAQKLYELYSQLVENNAKLTSIIEHNSTQVAQLGMGLSANNTGMMELGIKIDNQTIHLTSAIGQQNKAYNDYQVLVSDNLSAHDATLINSLASIDTLRLSIDGLKIQLEANLKDHEACSGNEKLMSELLLEVVKLRTELKTRRPKSEIPLITTNGGDSDKPDRLPDTGAKPTR